MKKRNAIVTLTLVVLFASTFFSSCKKNDEEEADVTADIFITCEGPFGAGTGTISKYNVTSKAVQNDAFKTVNGFDLGNTVQSVSVFNDRAYIVVNNANKIEVTTASTLSTVGQITGLNDPRNFLGISDDKGYVTEWGNGQGQVMVINLQTLMVIDSIPCDSGAENMIRKGDYVYVTNSGGFGNSNKVTVINPSTDEVVTNITVGANPTGIVTDADGKIWVLCNGTFGNLDGSLVRISTTNNAVDRTIPTQLDYYQARLTTNKEKNKLYFSVGDKTFAHSITSTTFNNNPWVSRGFYSVAADLNNDILYCADPKDYVSNGWILRYDLTTNAVLDSFETGVIPGNFYFN